MSISKHERNECHCLPYLTKSISTEKKKNETALYRNHIQQLLHQIQKKNVKFYIFIFTIFFNVVFKFCVLLFNRHHHQQNACKVES